MSEIYTVRMFAGSLEPKGARVIANVPSGMRWIVRTAVIMNPGSAALPWFRLWGGPAPANAPIAAAPSLAGHSATQFEGRVVLEQGRQLVFTLDSGTAWVSVTGYQFIAT